MLSCNLVNNNDNLLNIIFSYANVKDLSLMNCVNRSFNRLSNTFNHYWREACNNYFCSSYEPHSLFKESDYCIPENESKNSLDWKKNFKLGIQIKNNWTNIANYKKNVIPNFSEDSEQACYEVYNSLKEISSLPKLRKENLYVESDLNTIHQKNMYDFLYDQQDVYDYYSEIFEDRSFPGPINVRQPFSLFSSALEDFDNILLEFSEEKDIQSLANLRWYIFQFDNCESLKSGKSLVVDDNMNQFPPNDDPFSIFSTTYTDTYSAKLIEEYQIKNNNHILSLLNSLVLTLTFFCKLSLNYITKYSSNDGLFMDCYIKRYKAFIEAAVYLNEILENLNVIVNCLYESLFKGCPKGPKFSIYRLMIIVWNREVLIPLTDLKSEKNLINMSLKIFKRFLTNEVNKAHGFDVKINKSKSQPLNQFTCEETYTNCINYDCHSDDEGPLVINPKYTKQETYALSNYYHINTLDCGLGNNFPLYESKTSAVEEIYNFDFQAKYFLEQVPCLLLDTICNEYSTFYINDSQFPVSQSYQVYENNIVKIYEKFIQNYFAKANKLTLIKFFKSDDLINTKLIKRTKKRIVEAISQCILSQCEKELTIIFQDYLVSNSFNEKDAEMFLKAFDSAEEKNCPLYVNFINYSKEVLYSETLSEYATLYFIREIARGRNNLYVSMEETKSWLEETNEDQFYVDKAVRKENKRRNIHLDGDIYQAQLFNFTPNLSFSHILEIYGIDLELVHSASKNLSKQNEEFNMHLEDMSTFPQTYDAQLTMNIDMDIPMEEVEVDSSIELRRR